MEQAGIDGEHRRCLFLFASPVLAYIGQVFANNTNDRLEKHGEVLCNKES